LEVKLLQFLLQLSIDFKTQVISTTNILFLGLNLVPFCNYLLCTWVMILLFFNYSVVAIELRDDNNNIFSKILNLCTSAESPDYYNLSIKYYFDCLPLLLMIFVIEMLMNNV